MIYLIFYLAFAIFFALLTILMFWQQWEDKPAGFTIPHCAQITVLVAGVWPIILLTLIQAGLLYILYRKFTKHVVLPTEGKSHLEEIREKLSTINPAPPTEPKTKLASILDILQRPPGPLH